MEAGKLTKEEKTMSEQMIRPAKRIFEVRAKIPGNKHHVVLAKYKDHTMAMWDSLESKKRGLRVWGGRFDCHVHFPVMVVENN